jgi:hypothetical protein
MKPFIVRVQLSNETPGNYTILKNALLKVGFSKKIVAKTGVSYILPNGNYLAESEKESEAILEIVKSVTIHIGDAKAMILVSETIQNAWINLPK